VKLGKRPDAEKSNVPPSMIAPPIDVPCPPMNLVSECTTTSAPHSIGRIRYGVGTVLSTMSGTPTSCATLLTPSMSSTLLRGLASTSP